MKPNLIKALEAIAQGYPVAGVNDEMIVVDNPDYKEDNGSDPKLVIVVADVHLDLEDQRVELLARKMRQDYIDRWKPNQKTWDEIDQGMKDVWRFHARSAINFMKEGK